MNNMIKPKNAIGKLFLLFFIVILFSQILIPQVAADKLQHGDLQISSGSELDIPVGTNTILNWQFEVATNERAIYWEIIGYNVFEKGWGSRANCTTPILNDTQTTYNFICHGYYAKYHVWSTIIITCTEQENGGFDPTILLIIGVPIVVISGIVLVIVLALRHKKSQDFF